MLHDLNHLKFIIKELFVKDIIIVFKAKHILKYITIKHLLMALHTMFTLIQLLETCFSSRRCTKV